MRRIGDLQLVVGEVKTAITGTVAPGRVIEQNPPSSKRVAVESVVDIVVEAESVAVPSLTGKMLQDAKYTLQNVRLELGQVKEQMTGRFEPGTVTSQSPQQMIRVAPYTPVAVTVEAESVVVPELRNYQVDQAHELLVRVGLKVGSQKRQLVANVAAGTVIGQNPPPGERVRKFSPVSLTIAEAGVEVPPLTGIHYKRAMEILRRAGLAASNPTRQPRADMAADTVISQSPRAGTLVRQGTNVHLEISQKPVAVVPAPLPLPPVFKPPTLPMQAVCTVPNVMHKTENAAMSMIRKAGLVPRIDFRLGGEQVVTRQVPPGNTTASCGSTVTFSIGTLQ
jgi:serine/threonine-protein kinase